MPMPTGSSGITWEITLQAVSASAGLPVSILNCWIAPTWCWKVASCSKIPIPVPMPSSFLPAFVSSSELAARFRCRPPLNLLIKRQFSGGLHRKRAANSELETNAGRKQEAIVTGIGIFEQLANFQHQVGTSQQF